MKAETYLSIIGKKSDLTTKATPNYHEKRLAETWLTRCPEPRAINVLSASRKRPVGSQLTFFLKSRAVNCQYEAGTSRWTLTYKLWKVHTSSWSASSRNSLLNSFLQSVQSQEQPIVSIIQKRPPGPWLTSWSNPTPFYCQNHAEEAEKASWTVAYLLFKPIAAHCQYHAAKASLTLTYFLFKTQSSPLSASCRKGFLDPDLQTVQSPNISSQHNKKKGLLDYDLHPVQKPEQHIVSQCRKNFMDPWLTSCLKPRAACCQHHAEKAEKTSWTLTYLLFKAQSSQLSASYRKGLLNPDLQTVQNTKQAIISIMQNRAPGCWFTSC